MAHYETIPPEQKILDHPLIKFTNNVEDKELDLKHRSGITIKDPGVKNSVRFAEKVNRTYGGDSSQIFDSIRITFCLEKFNGVGFLLHHIKQYFSGKKLPTKYERLKFTKSFY